MYKTISIPFALTVMLFAGCGKSPNLQRDGGTIITYDLAPGTDGNPVILDPAEKEMMVLTLQRRLDPSDSLGVVIRFTTDNRLDIGVPGSDLQVLDRIKKLAETAGHLELLILANRHDHETLIEFAREQQGKLVHDGDKLVGKWVDVDYDAAVADRGMAMVSIADDILRDGETGRWLVDDQADTNSEQQSDSIDIPVTKKPAVEVLVAVDEDPAMNFQGKHLAMVTKRLDESGRPCLSFLASSEGAAILSFVTAVNAPDRQRQIFRRLGVIIDGHLVSAPRISSVISDTGLITGNFTEDEIDRLAVILRSGNLPIALQTPPLAERTVPPADK